MEHKLPETLNAELVKLLMNSKEAQFIFFGYTQGKELSDKFKIKAEFTITTE